MPDWTYHTIFKPMLTRIAYAKAQALVFGSMGMLSATAAGRGLIRLMGHGKPSEEMTVRRGDFTFAAPTALSAGVDCDGQATNALGLFGFGLIEVGPTANPKYGAVPSGQKPEWRPNGAISQGDFTLHQLADIHAELLSGSLHLPENVSVILRLCEHDGENEKGSREFRYADSEFAKLSILTESLAGNRVTGYSVAGHRVKQLRRYVQQPIFARVKVADAADAIRDGADGVIIDLSDQLPESACEAIESAREAIGDERVLIAELNTVDPVDAIEPSRAGADLIMIRSAFAESGPGLPKRINRLITEDRDSNPELYDSNLKSQISNLKSKPAPWFSPNFSFFWSGLMGIALFVGGIIATILGSTRVLLPYDEEYLGMLREELCGFSDKLLPFMSHDRVTLAGTMLSLGTLYIGCSVFGERHGQRWARTSVLTSAFVGFLSFFSFLGFGYFDPFHAFIAAILFQFILLGLRSPLPEVASKTIDLRNDPAWKRALWGQLLFVAHGIAILVAGIVISTFGVTTVFVQEDLDFMQITAEEISKINPRLVPLVAHDRASFGGMLMSTGVLVTLMAMWGWQRGRSWIWHSLGIAGTLAYGSTIAIHWAVGYTSLKHLMPAYVGLAVLWFALLISRGWLCDSEESAV